MIALTADSIFAEAWLLCFDEFHVTDIADAMILGRLFGKLFELGVVVVATSNVAPDDLYKDGLNRALFLPFIGQIDAHMDVLQLDARTDFRLEKLAGLKMWLRAARCCRRRGARQGLGRDDRQRAAAAARHLDQGPQAARSAAGGRGGAVSFQGAMRDSRSAASDYLRLAHDYPYVVDRPHSGDGLRQPQRRQALHHADRYALRQCREARGLGRRRSDRRSTATEDGVEAIEFQRTASRLTEMGSESYLALPHGRRDR